MQSGERIEVKHQGAWDQACRSMYEASGIYLVGEEEPLKTIKQERGTNRSAFFLKITPPALEIR